MYCNYKINQAIRVRYLSVTKETGLTDLKLTATDPTGTDDAPITFTEIGNGIYEASFTPDAIGWWSARVSSVLKPANAYSQNYFVGTEYDKYPSQEDGKLTSIDTKIGEVQANPTSNTLLARLKDIYDKLVSGISAIFVPLTILVVGQKTVTVAGTPVLLLTGEDTSTITIKALSTNKGNIYIGKSTVTSTTCYILSPGESVSIDLNIKDLVYINAAKNNDIVCYIGGR